MEVGYNLSMLLHFKVHRQPFAELGEVFAQELVVLLLLNLKLGWSYKMMLLVAFLKAANKLAANTIDGCVFFGYIVI